MPKRGTSLMQTPSLFPRQKEGGYIAPMRRVWKVLLTVLRLGPVLFSRDGTDSRIALEMDRPTPLLYSRVIAW